MQIGMMREFGQCPCGGKYEQRTVEVRFNVGERIKTLSDIPQGVCPLCGSRIYKARVLERIEAVNQGELIDHALNRLEM